MESSSWPGVVLLVVAVGLLAVVTAAEAADVPSNRARLRLLAGRGASRSGTLARYLQERHAIYSSLALARNLALIGSTAIVVYIVLNEAGLNWAVLAVTFFIALIGLAVIQALPRLVVSRNPQRWTVYLSPFVGSIRLLFRLPAALFDLPARALVGWRRPGGKATEPEGETDDLLRLLEMEGSGGLIDEGERRMIRRIVALEDTAAREIMVPRIDIVALPSDSSFEESLASSSSGATAASPSSRTPSTTSSAWSTPARCWAIWQQCQANRHQGRWPARPISSPRARGWMSCWPRCGRTSCP